MSEMPTTDERNQNAAVNGAAALHTRIADLLDDVIVSAPPSHDARTGAATEFAPRQMETGSVMADSATEDSAGSFMAQAPAAAPEQPLQLSAQPEAEHPVERAVLPGEPLMGASRRSSSMAPADLPPFLQKPSASDGEAKATPIVSEPPIPDSVIAAPEPVTPPTNMAAFAPTPPLPVDSFVATGDEASSDPAANQIVNMRGRSDGVAIEVGNGAWSEVLRVLAGRLEKSASFFRNSSVALDVGPRPLREDELQQIAAVLTAHEMTLGILRTSSERSFQAGLAVGMTATLESPEGAAMAAATTAATNATERGTEAAGYFVYRGYLRSGHRLRRQESILVIGDINPGAEVISDADILVWGRLRGIVHAGAGGNRRALVAALDLEPTQMRIADMTTIGPDPKPGQPGRFFWRRSQHKRPEIARLVQNEIVIEEWDASRPGGFVSLRRGTG